MKASSYYYLTYLTGPDLALEEVVEVAMGAAPISLQALIPVWVEAEEDSNHSMEAQLTHGLEAHNN